MQEISDDSMSVKKPVCLECENPVIVPDTPTPLCEACRQKLIRFPIPKWIKIFGATAGLIVIFSMYKLPNSIMAGVHLEKGKTAFSERRYLTAQKELEKFEKQVPDNIEANSYLFIASYYNEDMNSVSRLFTKLQNENFEDQALLTRVEEALTNSAKNFPGDSLTAMLERHQNNIALVPDDSLIGFIHDHPDDVYSMMHLAARFNDKNAYKSADSILTGILSIDENFFPALQILSSVKRQENELEKSIECCNKLLQINKESSFAMASKSRTLLKQKKDGEALELAKKSYETGNGDPYSSATLVLAYHFNKQSKEKSALLQKIAASKDSSYAISMEFANDVMSGKEFFRN